MEEIEKKVYKLIFKMSRQKLSNELGIDHRTLTSRLDKGGWLKREVEIIERLTSEL